MRLNAANNEARIEVERSCSIAILVSRDQSSIARFVVEVYADTGAAGLHYLGALNVDTLDMMDAAARPALLLGTAWVPGAIGYVVRLTQMDTPAFGDGTVTLHLSPGPACTRAGVTPLTVDHFEHDGGALANLVQLSPFGPRRLTSLAVYLSRGVPVPPHGSYWIQLFDRSATDAAIVAGDAPDYSPIPILAAQKVALGSDDVDRGPILRFGRGLRAILSEDDTIHAPVAGGPWGIFYAQTRA